VKNVTVIGAMALVCVLSGCASTTNQNDPLEGYNRAMFSFNDNVDIYAFAPVAEGYKTIMPSFLQTGIGNFFGNLGDVWSAANQLLQGRGEVGISSLMRVAINTTFGLGGMLDIATEAHLSKQKSDFGQTLGAWGVGSGPYIVLPLLGSSTMRDVVGTPVDWSGDPWSYKKPVDVRNIGTVIRIVDRRAQLLDAGNLLNDIALDKYVFMRDAYLQSRQSQIDVAKGKSVDQSPENRDGD
jgi:phospholipid-binding lipoprotein MlaA